jgi:hypothetical protein
MKTEYEGTIIRKERKRQGTKSKCTLIKLLEGEMGKRKSKLQISLRKFFFFLISNGHISLNS